MAIIEYEAAFYENDTDEIIFYGADLLDYHLIPYRGKLKTAIAKELPAMEAYILIHTKRNNGATKVPVSLVEEKKVIYIAKNNFNCFWKDISYLLYRALEKTEKNPYVKKHEVEKYVDLSFYRTEHRKAVIENGQIKLVGIQPSEEERKLHGRRASAMDNKKLIFVGETGRNVIHDKSCPLVKNIKDADFKAFEEPPEGSEFCKECRKRVYIRRGCGDDFKRYDTYSHFFKKGHVNFESIGELTGEFGAKIRMEGMDTLVITCREDTWKITFGHENRIVLWHNNYTMISDTERYICGGFHKQNVPNNISMTGAICYIEKYTWEKHLAAKKHQEEMKNQKLLEKIEAGVIKQLEQELQESEETKGKLVAASTMPERTQIEQSKKLSRYRVRLFWEKFKEWLKRK